MPSRKYLCVDVACDVGLLLLPGWRLSSTLYYFIIGSSSQSVALAYASFHLTHSYTDCVQGIIMVIGAVSVVSVIKYYYGGVVAREYNHY